MTRGFDDPVQAVRNKARRVMMVSAYQLQKGYVVQHENGAIDHLPFTPVMTLSNGTVVVHVPPADNVCSHHCCH